MSASDTSRYFSRISLTTQHARNLPTTTSVLTFSTTDDGHQRLRRSSFSTLNTAGPDGGLVNGIAAVLRNLPANSCYPRPPPINRIDMTNPQRYFSTVSGSRVRPAISTRLSSCFKGLYFGDRELVRSSLS